MLAAVSRLDDSAARFTAWLGGGLRGVARAEGALFAFALGVAVACYGIRLFNMALTLDEELQSVSTGADLTWIQQDRWGMYLLNAVVLRMPVVPHISTLLGLAALALATTIAIRLWEGGGRGQTAARGFPAFAAAGVLVSTPTLVFLVHFNTVQYGVFLAMAAAFIGVGLFLSGRWRLRLAGLALLIPAISVYQSVALAALCMYLFAAINRQLREPFRESRGRRVWSEPLFFAAWLGVACIGHKATAVLARSMIPPHEGYNIVDIPYQGLPWRIYPFETVVGYMSDYLGGGRWFLGWPAAAIVIGGVLLVLTRLVYRERASLGLPVGIALLAATAISPFLIVIVTGWGWWPTRTLLAFPVLLAGLVYTGIGTRSALARAVFGAVVLIALWHFAVANNRLLSADHQQWEVDREMIHEIRLRLQQAGMSNQTDLKLAIIGGASLTPSAGRFTEETIGLSFFSADLTDMRRGSASVRVARVMKIFGVGGVEGISTPAEMRAAVAVGEAMPPWPAEGSVAVRDGLGVVKLGPPSDAQIRFLSQADAP